MKGTSTSPTGSTAIWVTLAVIAAVGVVGLLMYTSNDDTDSTDTNTNASATVNTTQNTNTDTSAGATTNENTEVNANVSSATYTGSVLAGSTAPLLDFTQADYEAALQTDKLVVLYFYANWCPICKEEVADALYPAFNELTRDDVIGFRVNYNDNQTDDDEEALAREFGIAYQHSKVFVKNGERVLKAPDSWEKSRYLSEITSAAN